MAYTPTEWQNGDTITAEKLNKAENGIAANSNAVIKKYVSGPWTEESGNYISHTGLSWEEAAEILSTGGVFSVMLPWDDDPDSYFALLALGYHYPDGFTWAIQPGTFIADMAESQISGELCFRITIG